MWLCGKEALALRLSRPKSGLPPERSAVPLAERDTVVVVMQEYAAVWAEIHASLASQVSVLSFWRRHTWAVGGRGIAAVGYGLRDRRDSCCWLPRRRPVSWRWPSILASESG